jgi:hypothetical protein
MERDLLLNAFAQAFDSSGDWNATETRVQKTKRFTPMKEKDVAAWLRGLT